MSTTTNTGRDAKPFSPTAEAWRRFRKDRLTVAMLVLVGVFAAMALTAQVVELVDGAPFVYEQTLAERGIDVPEKALPPSTVHPLGWLGTTSAGKSVGLRVFHGAKVAFLIGIMGAGLAVLIGMTLGLFAGFLGKVVDEAIVYLYSTVSSIPSLLLILAVAFVLKSGPIGKVYGEISIGDWVLSEYVGLGLFSIIAVVGLTSWVTLCRLIRAETKKVKELDYVQAARSLGFSDVHIMFKHVLPNVFHLVIIDFSLTFVRAIKAEVILTFLGVGVDQEPSWGRMIADAKSELMQGIWWPLLSAGVLLFLLTLSVNYVGDALRDALDPKLKQ